jgi:short-subunit dehydrogenase
MSAEDVARQAIDGTAAGKAICIPGLGYKVAATVSDITPRGVRRRFMGLVAGQATRLARRQDR